MSLLSIKALGGLGKLTENRATGRLAVTSIRLIVLALFLICGVFIARSEAKPQSSVSEVKSITAKTFFPGVGSRDDWLAANQLYRQSTALQKSGQFEEAIATVQKAIALYPHDSNYDNLLAVLYYQRNKPGDLKLAEQALRQGIELTPNSCQLWDNLAKGLYEQHRLGDAREALLKALSCEHSAEKEAEIKENIEIIDKQLPDKSKQM